MPVKTRPSEHSVAQPTVWSVILGAGVPRGTASMMAFAASIRESWVGVRGILKLVFGGWRNLEDVRSLDVLTPAKLCTKRESSIWKVGVRRGCETPSLAESTLKTPRHIFEGLRN